MKRVFLGALTSVLLTGMMMFLMPIQAKITAGDITGGKKAPHVNIAIFHKLHGHDDFQYPEEIKSTDILQATEGKAQFIAINHTSGLKDGDIIVVNNDVLREGDKDFEDFGVDCQLSVHFQGDDVVTLAGMCQMLIVDQDHREIDHKGVVKLHTLQADQSWHLIYYDHEDGIAVYADAEVGLE